ncbi:spexin [Manis pentadactyla]|uniref:spexin n=1 Tax=Manis pentadactyla TaxID=143292 RepID=UPI00255CCD2B|nr:spexin [Manis pentadactyla]
MTFSSSFLVGTQKSGGNNVGPFPGVFFRGKLQRRAPDWAAMPREPLFCPPYTLQSLLERRNWTPQAMLYLRGAQGRRFISHQSRRKDVAERPPPERRSPSPQLLNLPEAAPVLMGPLQTHRKLEKKPEQMRFVEDSLLYW